MSALTRISRHLTAGRVLVGLLVAMNVVLCVALLRSLRGPTSEKRLRSDGDASPARPSMRAARRAGQADEGVRRADDDRQAGDRADGEPDPLTPPEDPEEAFARLVDLVHPTPGQERVMRDAFDHHYPGAEAAYRAHDLATAGKAWRAYCDEVAPAFDEKQLKKLGCIEAPPPPNRQRQEPAPPAAPAVLPEPAPPPAP